MSAANSPRWTSLPLLGRLWQAWRSLSPPVPEDSVTLRVLVQLLVIVGIVATDVAAGTTTSLWAVPLSIMGASWSWFRRRERNIVLKFVLAIALIVTLVVFLSNLVTTLNDTRVILAELLIQVQVLHTFDLPRRKDLGYSMIIALILIGVAGTISQTMAFAPFLVVFLLLAIPTLIYDYRSRLGLGDRTSDGSQASVFRTLRHSFPWKASLTLGLLVLSLGLVLFAAIPRVPGYQLRSFPVSSTIDFRGDFDGRNIASPQAQTDGTQFNGEGDGTAEGPGEVDETFYAGFSESMNQNLRGSMTPQVVMRVRSQAPGFWRVIAFDEYTGQGWRISRNDDVRDVRRSPWSFRFDLPFMGPRSFTQEVIQTYSIVADFPGLIPVLDQPRYLYFPTEDVAIGPEGSLRSPVPLSDGLTYSVVSHVSLRDRTRLGEADTTYPQSISDVYLQVPDEIEERLRDYTQSVLDNAVNPLTNPYEISLYLAQYLKQNYDIPQDPFGLEFLDEGEDLALDFLFRCEESPNPAACTPGGYPDHFSTVFTLLLRSVGIPARLATGFGPGNFNPFTGLYEVKNTHAFALTEVYFPSHGWFAFDPIPGHEVIPPSVSEYEPFGVLRQFWDWIAGWLPSPVAGFINGIFVMIGRAIDWFLARFSEGWLGILSGLLTLVLFSFAGWLSWQGWREWKRRRWLSKLAQMERLYQQMLQRLAADGCPKHPAHTPLEFARQVGDRYPPEVRSMVSRICQAYVGWRYGKESVPVEELRQQWQTVQRQDWRRKLATLRGR
ncbi:transglutaminase TgpA family protein [Sodalinema gerasimenkoae]|uniref:transglutaminase TgpA family protein n=1 Tax=Sodalinema gerasimenkoae TaxID=2862348 RepID=UPI0018656C4C|nr:DUF3488 and DUF4129 domain-containing transglutaminase family protein [Sodalinema gerasimenkoae]